MDTKKLYDKATDILYTKRFFIPCVSFTSDKSTHEIEKENKQKKVKYDRLGKEYNRLMVKAFDLK